MGITIVLAAAATHCVCCGTIATVEVYKNLSIIFIIHRQSSRVLFGLHKTLFKREAAAALPTEITGEFS